MSGTLFDLFFLSFFGPLSRLAIKYIRHLQYLLSFPPGQKIPAHIVEFDPSLPAWIKSKNLPGAVSIEDLEASHHAAAAAAAAAAAGASAADHLEEYQLAEEGPFYRQSNGGGETQQQQIMYDNY